MAIGER